MSHLPITTREIKVAAFANEPIAYRQSLYRRVANFTEIDLNVIYASTGGSYFPRYEVDNASLDSPYLIDGVPTWFLKRASTNLTSDSFLSFRDFDIISRLHHLSPDVLWLHGYNSLTHQLAAYYQKLRRKPLLIREEMTIGGQRSLWKRAAKQVGLRPLLHNSRGLYIGTENRRWFQKYGVPIDRLHFTPYAVENDFFQDSLHRLWPDRQTIRKQFGIESPTTVTICTVCRLVPKKNVGLLIDAYRTVSQSLDCALLVVGSGPLESELRRQVAETHTPNVTFTGHLPQEAISRAYVASDIFVLSSAYDETWGLVVNEAMNFGLPIIVSDQVGSRTDLISSGTNGFVFHSGDVLSLSKSLRALIESPQLRTDFGSESQRIIASWTHERASLGVREAILSAVRQNDLTSD